MIQTTYREIPIFYNELNEVWECEVGEKKRQRTNLQDCKNAIDKYLDGEEKLKKKFPKFEVFANYGFNGSEFEKATVTSILGEDVWVTDSKGGRKKYSGSWDCKKLILITDDNLNKIKEIKEKESKIKEMEDELEELRQSLSTVNPKEILKTIEQ